MNVGEIEGDVTTLHGERCFYLHSMWADSRLVPLT